MDLFFRESFLTCRRALPRAPEQLGRAGLDPKPSPRSPAVLGSVGIHNAHYPRGRAVGLRGRAGMGQFPDYGVSRPH
ncbi:hypothetical protein EYF80_001851 [Liparis tanakae]|uniref:Uncharacterized protein n=1 Tax=Liparis tanakae TaxID=230148 RepID=A0A4Z2JD40_9TELE|nr:hypothetical protein EYF80_001851 [Liparis tanakae]